MKSEPRGGMIFGPKQIQLTSKEWTVSISQSSRLFQKLKEVFHTYQISTIWQQIGVSLTVQGMDSVRCQDALATMGGTVQPAIRRTAQILYAMWISTLSKSNIVRIAPRTASVSTKQVTAIASTKLESQMATTAKTAL